MTEETENQVIEHLHWIRASMDRMQFDICDLKSRVTAMEIIMRQLVSILTAQSRRLDRFEERMGRIERRLELATV